MGSYEVAENGIYKITKNNEPSEAIMMCNMREICVADNGNEIAKDAAPEGIKINENEITNVLPEKNPNSQIPESEEEIIQVNKRVDEALNNNNLTTTTQVSAVDTTTVSVQTTSEILTENSSVVKSSSNIPESENEDTSSQSPLTSLQTLSTPLVDTLTETGSGVEITTKNNEIQTTLLQTVSDITTSSGDLRKEEINITTTDIPSNITIPENLTGSTPTFNISLVDTTTSSIINQETTTLINLSSTKSAELNPLTETVNNPITTNSSLGTQGNESKEFDNSNESGDLTTKLQETTQTPLIITTSNPIIIQEQQTTIINNNNNNVPQELNATTESLIVNVTNTTTLNIDTTTTSQTTTLINTEMISNQNITNTSTPETINKFLESHESDNSKENKEIIDQINNDNGKNNTCGDSHKDLSICENYMNEYLNRVDTWARQRNDTLDNQLWKACSLLKKVPHVPTLCCHIFSFKCGSHVTRPPTATTTISSLV
ncbi:Hypothetical protein SRAE_1000281400 [Strongyloides ratti]|uniref:Uncharacterized protein n=1 Tax=Strongyloides ratti TaxID=34506 RepID=A0A090LAJ3_STRRB|nr:Hypothetical protein SRAE_1000281400 [Strongyloides ratti]CEF64560.1 Hypothetical protein SRAE_1000281400 [Strongyloides ratti]